MEETIVNYIKEELLGGSFEDDILADDDLLNSGLIDSLGIMRLISFVEEKYGIKVPPQDMVIENFVSAEAIAQYIQTKSN